MLKTALLDGHRPLGIAVSGGSDSTALLMLALEAYGPECLHAITVDHGLRMAAAQEARQIATLCAKFGIPHETVRLDIADGPDLQARARAGRYNALSAWAKRHNIAALALGHTQEDVAETFLMRLARGSGVDGLASMPERFVRDGVTFLRPLLAAKRADLQNYLDQQEVAWSDDPSNSDPRFTRVQMRQAQTDLVTLGLTTLRLSQTANWMRAASEVLENAADTWIARHAYAEHGDAVFNLAALRSAPDETAARVLSRALCNISGNPYRPRFSALKTLLHAETAQTLHGCLAYIHKGKLRLTREPNAIKSHDPRWTISGPLTQDHNIKPLGETHVPDWRETALLPRRSLSGSPSIWLGAQLIAAPIAQPHPEWRATTANPLHLSK